MRHARACTTPAITRRDNNVRWRGIDPHLKTFFGRDLPSTREVLAEEFFHTRELADLAAIESYAGEGDAWEMRRIAEECLGDWTAGLYALEDVLMQRGVKDFHDVAYALYREWSIEDAERSDRKFARMMAPVSHVPTEDAPEEDWEDLMGANVYVPVGGWNEAVYAV